MDTVQADSEKMNQEVETTQLNQSARDTSISHLVAGIKEEPDNETKHAIHSQLPFLTERIKQELMCILAFCITVMILCSVIQIPHVMAVIQAEAVQSKPAARM